MPLYSLIGIFKQEKAHPPPPPPGGRGTGTLYMSATDWYTVYVIYFSYMYNKIEIHFRTLATKDITTGSWVGNAKVWLWASTIPGDVNLFLIFLRKVLLHWEISPATCLAILLWHKLHEKLPSVLTPSEMNMSCKVFASLCVVWSVSRLLALTPPRRRLTLQTSLCEK